MEAGTPPFRQELPPPGGYRKFDWVRLPPRPMWSSFKLYGGLMVMTAFGYAIWKVDRRIQGLNNIEDIDGKVACEPLLLAERDRLMLRHCLIQRAEEERIMKDVPGWQLGKFFDEPIYYTVPKDMWIEPDVRYLWQGSSERAIKNWKLHYMWT